MKPPVNVERPATCMVPEVYTFPLPPLVASTQNRPVLKVVVLIPTARVPLVMRVLLVI